MGELTGSAAWRALAVHRKEMEGVRIRDLFESDAARFERFFFRLDGGLLFDYSKHRITEETVRLLVALAEQADVAGAIERMFAGERINFTENRPVLHVALRNRSNRPIEVDGEDVMPSVNGVLAKMRSFSTAVRGGDWKGYTGKRITHLVNIGSAGTGAR